MQITLVFAVRGSATVGPVFLLIYLAPILFWPGLIIGALVAAVNKKSGSPSRRAWLACIPLAAIGEGFAIAWFLHTAEVAAAV
ncbi:MAG: hypothetical protein AAGH64_01095 [Planctomycetota bacterium]